MKLGWITLLLLAGCATPQEMRAESERHEWTSAKAPADLARCIARYGEENTPMLYPTATVRDGGAGAFEVQLRNGTEILLVADVLPQGSGSRATVYRRYPHTTNLPAAMAKGC